MQTTSEELVALLRHKGIVNAAVLNAISQVPRHLFVDSTFASQAYQDTALPIAHKQTISQPYIVALMTELLLVNRKLSKVLEIGTGSGYQAAVLAHVVEEVYTIERIEGLYKEAKQRLQQLGLSNVFSKLGDGTSGWSEVAPFDGIMVTAATPSIPQSLLEQLAEGGRMVVPVGEAEYQELHVITRLENDYLTEIYNPVMFVPLLAGIEK